MVRLICIWLPILAAQSRSKLFAPINEAHFKRVIVWGIVGTFCRKKLTCQSGISYSNLRVAGRGYGNWNGTLYLEFLVLASWFRKMTTLLTTYESKGTTVIESASRSVRTSCKRNSFGLLPKSFDLSRYGLSSKWWWFWWSSFKVVILFADIKAHVYLARFSEVSACLLK